MAILSVVIAQFLYTLSDTWKKVVFNNAGFSVKTLTSPVFLLTLVIAAVGFAFQMYALSKIELSRTIVMLGMLAVVFSAVAGVFYLKEHLNAWNWAGVALALVAIVLVNVK
jgi:drug/metabolite transporter (DMT)-like permease